MFCFHSTIVVRCALYKTQVVYSASLKKEPQRNHYCLNACGVYCLNATDDRADAWKGDTIAFDRVHSKRDEYVIALVY